jgi:hypothetical protein
MLKQQRQYAPLLPRHLLRQALALQLHAVHMRHEKQRQQRIKQQQQHCHHQKQKLLLSKRSQSPPHPHLPCHLGWQLPEGQQLQQKLTALLLQLQTAQRQLVVRQHSLQQQQAQQQL